MRGGHDGITHNAGRHCFAQGGCEFVWEKTSCASASDPKDVFDAVFQDMQPNDIYTPGRAARGEYFFAN